MKIGIDARLFNLNSTGIGRYTTCLILHLQKLNTSHTFYLFTNRDLPDNLFNRNFKVINIPIKKNLLWIYIFLPFYIRKYKLDVYHGLTNFEIPFWKPCKFIITMHDIIPLKHPNTVTLKYWIICKLLIGKALHKADKVITVSRFSKKEILGSYKIDEKKIIIISQAIEKLSKGDTSNKNIVVSKNYIMFVGRIESRKNIKNLLLAFCNLKKQISLPDLKLVIVGEDGGYFKQMKALINKLNMVKDVITPGFLPDNDVAALYKNAQCFVFPSLSEGFGFPPLEAMANGVPVICSDLPAIKENTENAVLYIDPYNVEMICEKMKVLLEDRKLRNDLVQKGLKQAAKFSWEKTAIKTLKVYENNKL